jgi:hypothetical protein
MSRIQYYLVNHTRKEFCYFNARAPVYEELKRITEAWPKWKTTDTIMIKGEDESKAPDMWENLTMNLRYRDLDYDEHMGN